jgi:hypothetical protein
MPTFRRSSIGRRPWLLALTGDVVNASTANAHGGVGALYSDVVLLATVVATSVKHGQDLVGRATCRGASGMQRLPSTMPPRPAQQLSQRLWLCLSSTMVVGCLDPATSMGSILGLHRADTGGAGASTGVDGGRPAARPSAIGPTILTQDMARRRSDNQGAQGTRGGRRRRRGKGGVTDGTLSSESERTTQLPMAVEWWLGEEGGEG